MMYDGRADDISNAIGEAVSLLETLAENELINEVYGDDINRAVSDLESANNDLDDMDTDFNSREEDDRQELEDAINEAASDIDTLRDELYNIQRNLEWAV